MKRTKPPKKKKTNESPESFNGALLKVFCKRACSLAFLQVGLSNMCVKLHRLWVKGYGLNCVVRFHLILLHYDIHVRLRTGGSSVSF